MRCCSASSTRRRSKRGWYSSWPQLGVPIGLLLSTGAVKALGLLGEDALLAGAWRIPFLASIVLVAIGLFIRLRIAEPPAFRELVDHDARAARAAARGGASAPEGDAARRWAPGSASR